MPTILKSARPGSASPTRVVLAVLLCMLLSGCRLGLDVALDLARDGSGGLAVRLAADAAAVERAAEAGADPLGVLAGAGEELSGQGWETRDETAADGSREVELAVEADSAETLSAEAATLAAALAAPEARPLEPLTVTVTEDRIQVAGAAALVPETAVAEYGLTPEQAVALLDQRDALDYTVSVTLPAEVVSSDATTTAGSTLSWVVPPGQRIPITAEGVRPRFPWVLAGAAATVALVLLALAARLAARRRSRRRLASLRPWEG